MRDGRCQIKQNSTVLQLQDQSRCTEDAVGATAAANRTDEEMESGESVESRDTIRIKIRARITVPPSRVTLEVRSMPCDRMSKFLR